MAKVTLVIRILLGLVFFVFGIMGLFNLVPPPPNMPEKLTAFTNGLMATGYFMPFLKGTEIICGALLLSGYFVPLALVVLAPIVIHIFLVHTILEPSGFPVAMVIVLFEAYLAFFAEPYKQKIKVLFQPK